MKQYDYLIIGAGIYGSIFAFEATKRGKKCLVIDKRSHIGGNMYTERINGINVHTYGPHIFHTNEEYIWKYINQFTEFKQFVYSPIALYEGKLYNLPFNMHTFYQLWGITDPSEVKARIEKQASSVGVIKNLEDQAISLVGMDVYEILIKGYTEKQWGRDCRELPKSIIKRLPVRFTFDNNYFNDKYQGMPINGYTHIFENLLADIEVKLNCDYFSDRSYFDSLSEKVIYTGPIDHFFDYKFGQLDYRSLEFRQEKHFVDNYQATYVINHTDKTKKYTRSIEHKHFDGQGSKDITIVTKEYPIEFKPGLEPYYPINDDYNNKKYSLYKEESKKWANFIFGGRLGEYRYYDMHQVIASALKTVNSEFLG